jgi:hypothetical protein
MENEMYPPNKNVYVFFLGILLLGAALVTCMGCDSLTPTDFKSQTYTASDIDLKAGNLLLRDTVNDFQGFTYSYQYGSYDSSGVPSLSVPVTYRVKPVTWSYLNSQIFDEQIIAAKFDSLTAKIPALSKDSLILVKYPAGTLVSYAVFKSSQAQDVYLYTGLQYYSGNLNDYVTVELIKRDNSIVSSSTNLSPESVYGSMEKMQVASATKILPAINGRFSVHLDQGGVYLVRFTLSAATISNPLARPSDPPVPSIANQFKVVILSY